MHLARTLAIERGELKARYSMNRQVMTALPIVPKADHDHLYTIQAVKPSNLMRCATRPERGDDLDPFYSMVT